MKIKAFCLVFSLAILHIKGTAQSIPQGLFSEKSVHNYGARYILELIGNKFYTYYLPVGVTATIIIRTGTCEITDTTITLKTDTTAAFSLNAFRLVYMKINCDSLQNMNFNAEYSMVTFFEEDVLHASRKVVRLERANESEIAMALKRFGGISIDQLRRYVVPPAGFEIKICNEK